MNRLIKFVRSVIPSDPTQLILLMGIVCLTVSPHLRWLPKQEFNGSIDQLFNDQTVFARDWAFFFVPAVWMLIFGWTAAYFACFWPGHRPLHRLLWLTCLPAVVGFTVICARFPYLLRRPISVLERDNVFLDYRLWPGLLWKLGPGFAFCPLGIVVVAFFVYRLGLDRTSLPLSLDNRYVLANEDPVDWKQDQILIWVLIGPLITIFANWFSFLTLGLRSLTAKVFFLSQSPWFSKLFQIFDAVPLLLISLCVIDRSSRRIAGHSLRIPEARYLVLGFAFPVAMSVIGSGGNYLFDRFEWAQRLNGYWPPQLDSYFSLPDPWLLLLFFAALSEEIVFRGVLQHRLVERYGISRGIFLVGIVWSAFQFFSDSYSRTSALGAVFGLIFRIFTCLVLSFVLGWLTLRSRSVLPAAIAHTLYNVSVYSELEPYFPGRGIVRVALWAALAYLLFRYWPSEPEAASDVIAPLPSLEFAAIKATTNDIEM